MKARNALGKLVCGRRGERGWSQQELAELSGLHVAEIQAIERGEQGYTPSQPTVHVLTKTLDLEEKEVTSAVELDKPISRREVLKYVAVGATLAIAPDLRVQAIPSSDGSTLPGLWADQEQVTKLAREVLGMHGESIRRVRHQAAEVARRNEDIMVNARHASNLTAAAPAAVIKARAQIVQAVTYNEDHAVPPQRGRELLLWAQESAHEGQDRDTYNVARWYEAVQVRKEADVTHVPDTCERAKGLLDKILTGETTPALRMLARVNQAKLEIGQGRTERARAIIEAAEEETLARQQSRPLLASPESWSSYLAEHAPVLLHEVKMRMMVAAGATVKDYDTVAREAQKTREYKAGMTITVDRVMIPFLLAQLLIQSSIEQERIDGLVMWHNALLFAQQERLQRQVSVGQRIGRDVARSHPVVGSFMIQWCPWCKKENATIKLRDDDNYWCSTCGQLVISIWGAASGRGGYCKLA